MSCCCWCYSAKFFSYSSGNSENCGQRGKVVISFVGDFPSVISFICSSSLTSSSSRRLRGQNHCRLYDACPLPRRLCPSLPLSLSLSLFLSLSLSPLSLFQWNFWSVHRNASHLFFSLARSGPARQFTTKARPADPPAQLTHSPHGPCAKTRADKRPAQQSRPPPAHSACYYNYDRLRYGKKPYYAATYKFGA
jgi:hypothetical protein